MSRRLLLALALLPVFAVGCTPLAAVPETPPPASPPAFPDPSALRPHFNVGTRTVPAGTGFVVADAAGKKYLLTAAHLMDDAKEWGTVRAVSLHAMEGGEVAACTGRPLLVGRSFDESNCGEDLVIWPLADGAKATPLKLAADDPKRNEWVWAVGQEPKASGPQKAYRCKVTGTTDGGLSLVQHDSFQMMGFSGGPLFNANGEVVGSVLGGRGKDMIVSQVSGIRKKLAAAGVSVP